MPNETKVIQSNLKQVSCSGEHSYSPGHPLIYLNMGDKDEIICPYCSAKFIYKQNHEH